MLSKCANPDCLAPFLYLHQGKLFRLDTADKDASGQDAGDRDTAAQKTQKMAQNLEFFWLCSDCSVKLTLRYRKGAGVVTVPLSENASAVGSAQRQRRGASATG
jgi:hypothetical protein